MGRPKDISPKAFFLSLLGYTKPFDRHDWIVDRNGQDVRYIIDFYKGTPVSVPAAATTAITKTSTTTNTIKPDSSSTTVPPLNEAAMSMYLDVRPALDSWGALRDRVSVYFDEQKKSFGEKDSFFSKYFKNDEQKKS